MKAINIPENRSVKRLLTAEFKGNSLICERANSAKDRENSRSFSRHIFPPISVEEEKPLDLLKNQATLDYIQWLSHTLNLPD
jgi:hypothetical protein